MAHESNDADGAPTLILEHLFLGSRAHARDKDILKRLKITHILNVTPPKTTDPAAGVPNFFEKEKSFTYRRCPIFDNKAEDISGVLEGCIAFMDQAKYYGRILVHCNKGVSRSTSMVVAYLMKINDMSFDEALQFVTERRSVANPNASFRRQLQEYGQKLSRRAAAAKNRVVKVARGPQGPSLPPRTEGSSTAELKSSIGPQLPLHLLRKEASSNPNDDSESADARVNKEGDKSTQDTSTEGAGEAVVIGPSLPPPRKRQRLEATHGDKESSSPRKKFKQHED